MSRLTTIFKGLGALLVVTGGLGCNPAPSSTPKSSGTAPKTTTAKPAAPAAAQASPTSKAAPVATKPSVAPALRPPQARAPKARQNPYKRPDSKQACEDGEVCTDLPAIELRRAVSRPRVAIPTPASSQKRPDKSSLEKMKALERNPGMTKALKQVKVRAFPAHQSITGKPGWMPGFGSAKAPVKVYVFSDYQCPVCRRVVEPLKQVGREFAADVQIVWVNNALKMHSHADAAARASLAAANQGKFWAYHDELFKDQRALSDQDLERHAKTLGLNMKKFKADMNSERIRNQVEYERNLSTKLGVRGTPGFFINGKRMVGWGSYSGFRAMVKRAIVAAKKLKPSKKGLTIAQQATLGAGETGTLFAQFVWGKRVK